MRSQRTILDCHESPLLHFLVPSDRIFRVRPGLDFPVSGQRAAPLALKACINPCLCRAIAQAVSCVKALRTASVAHIMGNKYNDFLAELKAKYQTGDNSDIWEMVSAPSSSSSSSLLLSFS